MSKIYLIVFALLTICPQSLSGQEKWMWPVKGAETGKGILYTPDSYIGKEHNFDDLYITAEEGTEIVSPVDGTIKNVGANYYHSLSQGTMSFSGGSFDDGIKSLIAKYPSFDPRYVTGSIGIDVSDGIVIWISGLTGSHSFKTGQKIRKGDFLGYMGYSYKEIKEPSVNVGVGKHGKAADPMTPFGLKTTFIPPKGLKPIEQISETQALEDFQIFTDAVEECYPTLYHCFSPEEFDSLKLWVKKEIIESRPDTTISYGSFRKLILACFSKINDSHIYLFPTLWDNDRPDYQPAVFIGVIDDTLRITNTIRKYKDLLGKKVSKMNGYDADSARKVSMYRVYEYDANVESYPDFCMAYTGLGPAVTNEGKNMNYNLDLEFFDGTKMSIPGIKNSNFTLIHNYLFRGINRQKEYRAAMLNDSTAYLGLAYFQYNQIQMEEIKAFVDSVSKADVPNMIVDVRNNNGGQDEVLQEIWSWFAQDTLELNGSRRINKMGNFKSFEYSDNYYGLEGELFPGYAKIEGIDGFCDTTFNQIYYPDINVNYKGKLYILTNEKSISAATLFPALAVRSHRGVTVGRETCSAYHYITALKFANFVLPNSQVRFCIPLVENVFDTQINERVPYGRGVLPDYEVPISYEEITGGKEVDLILDRALELIADNRYIEYDDPFIVEQEEPESTGHVWLIYVLAGIFAAAVIIGIIIWRKRK